jgi:hypothetical protein
VKNPRSGPVYRTLAAVIALGLVGAGISFYSQIAGNEHASRHVPFT